MNVIVCVDDKMGMMFNHRRQSRDAILIQDIITEVGAGRLWINEYSKKLFFESVKNLKVDCNFLNKAESNDFCFVEDQSLNEHIETIEKLILYKWNRKYPADFYLDVELSHWEKICETEFEGNSHEKITKEIYIKGELI